MNFKRFFVLSKYNTPPPIKQHLVRAFVYNSCVPA